MLLPSCRHSPSRNWGETVNCWRAITKRGLTGYVQGKATRTRPSWLTSVRSTTTQRLSEPQPKSSSWVMLLACTGGCATTSQQRSPQRWASRQDSSRRAGLQFSTTSDTWPPTTLASSTESLCGRRSGRRPTQSCFWRISNRRKRRSHSAPAAPLRSWPTFSKPFIRAVLGQSD